jgi:predicted phage terminase large subunit-like protein
LVAEDKEGKWWVLDVVRARLDPEQVQQLVLQIAKLDGKRVKIRVEQEPGASGKSMIANYVKILAGFNCEGKPHGGDKAAWSDGWAGQVNGGNVMLVKAPWNKPWLTEHAGFPNAPHDDQVDSAAGAFNDQVEGERQFKRISFLHV